MSEPLKNLYTNLLSSGKVAEHQLGKYNEFEVWATSDAFDLYQSLLGMGFNEKELGDWNNFSGYINRKILGNPEPNITPYKDEYQASQEKSKDWEIQDYKGLRPNYPNNNSASAKQTAAPEVVGQQEVPTDRPDAEVSTPAPKQVDNPSAPFKYRTADTIYVVDPSSRKAYDMDGNKAPDAILSEALEGRTDFQKQTKDAQTPTQDLINRNDRTWLEAQIRDKSEQVKSLRSEGKVGVNNAVGSPYYASQMIVQTNVNEIAPIEAELTDLQRQYAKLDYNDINNEVHSNLFKEYEKTPEFKTLQTRYEKLIGTVPINISDEAKTDFNAKYGAEIETLQAKLTQESMEAFSKSQELTTLQGKYQKEMDEFVRLNRSKPIFDSLYREKVKSISAEVEREQVKLFNDLYGEQIDKQVSELSNNKFMEYMKANPDKFSDYNNKVQNYINNFNELIGADFQKMYGKELEIQVGKQIIEKLQATDFLKNDFTTTSTEFILRGVDDSVLGGIIGRLSGINRTDQQIEDFYTPTAIESAARGALSIVIDTPIFAVTGAGGAALAARGTSLVARRLIFNAVARGASFPVAERAVLAAIKTKYAVTTGIAGSMGALGGYDQIRDLYAQSTDDLAGIDIKQNLKATGKGLVLGFGIGWIGMGSRVMNNYVTKSLNNRFASQAVSKGVEGATKAGVNLTALTVENAAFVYGSSFMEGREAAPEEFGEGMIMLGFLKAKGYFSQAAKAIPIKDKPQLNFTREELDYLLKPNNKAAWERVNEMGEMEMRAVFEDANAPLTMKMKIAASRGVAIDDAMIRTDGAKAVVVSDNGRYFVEYRSKEGQLLQKAEFKTAEEASTQAMILEALTVAKEALSKYKGLSATEKAKVNSEMKPEEKQVIAEVVNGKVNEAGLIAAAKLNETIDLVKPKEEAKVGSEDTPKPEVVAEKVAEPVKAEEVEPVEPVKAEPIMAEEVKPVEPEAELKIEADTTDPALKDQLVEIDNAIAEIKQNNPKEFKKNGELKTNSKLTTTLKALSDKRSALIEQDMKEFPERSAAAKEKSRIETEEINRKFDERQAELAASTKTTKEEIIESSIEDKLRFRNELSKEEIDYANENYFIPKGFKFGKDGLERIKSGKAAELGQRVEAGVQAEVKPTAELGKERVQESVQVEAKQQSGFTGGERLTEIKSNLKAKYGEKEGSSLYQVATRLVNPNKNTIEEVRSNGVIVKEGESYIFKPFGNTDAAKSKWTLYEGRDITSEFSKKTAELPVDAKRKALDDSINTLKESLKPKLKFAYDPKKEAEDMYNMHKAMVDVAKKAIDYYGSKIIKTAEDFAKVLGTKLTKPIRLAYEEAAGVATYTADMLKYSYEKAVEQISNITLAPEKSVGVAARDISRRETTKVLVDEFKTLKDQIKLEAKSAKQAATYIAKFLDANKKEIASVGLTVKDTTRIQKIAVKNEQSAIELMDKLINDADYRKAVRDAEASQKEIKKYLVRGEFNSLSKADKSTLNKIATVDLEGHYFSKEFLDAYNGMRKQLFENNRVPSPDAVGKFYSLFEQDVIDNHVRKEVAQEVDAKTVYAVTKRINSLYEQLQEWNTDPSKIDKGEIALAKARLSYLMIKASNFIKNGIFEVDSEKVKDIDTRLAEMETFINNDAEPFNKAIEDVESAYKHSQMMGLDLSPLTSTNLTNRNVNRYAKETAERLRRALKLAKDVGISDKLSLNDVDNIKAILSSIESGFIPKITTKIINKIEIAAKVKSTGNEIVSAIKENLQIAVQVKMLLAKYPTTQSLARQFDKWDKADVDKLLNLEKKRKGKPVEELITGALEQPLFTSNEQMDLVLRPVQEARAKAYASKIWNPAEYFRNKSKTETFDNMIGIALRSMNHIANLPTTLKKAEVEGGYEIVLADGKRYQEGIYSKKFKTVEEANQYIKENVERFFTPEELDFYHTVNFGRFKTQRANARLFENASLTERELERFDVAYKELQKLTGNEMVYFKTFDEITAKLPAKLKPYIESMRDALASTKDMAAEVASREGVNFVQCESYWPYPNMEMNVGRSGSTDIKDFASTMKAENVKSGNIYERVQSTHYTDFNARRVLERYIRTMVTDYYMNPESKVVLSTLREVSRGLGKEYRMGEELSAETKVVIDAMEQLIKDRFVAHLNSHQLFEGAVFGTKIGGKIFVFDLGQQVRNVLGFGRSTALISAPRRVIPEPVSNLSKIMIGFVKSGDKFNPLRISDKTEALLPVISDVSGSVRSLSSQRFQNKNYSQFELQQERNAIREFSEKYILQLGDMLTMRPIWMSKFETRFKELTGKEIDPAEWKRNEEYKDANYDAVLRSMRYADSVIEEIFPAQTKFGRAQTDAFGIRTASDVGALNMIMNSFGTREASTFVLAMKDAAYGSNLGRVDGVRRMAGLTVANFIWLASGQAVYSGTKYLFSLINDDEVSKEKALDAWRNAFSAEGIVTNLVANTLLLATGRYANAGRLIAGIAAGFAIDKILESEPDPIERANMKTSIRQGLAQLRTIGMTVPESSSHMTNMLFPIIAQSMSELGLDAANVGTYVVDLGKKVADGTASEDDIQTWTLLKATHDLMILKGYTHPFTKEMNMYLREKSRDELKLVDSYISSIKQMYYVAEYKPERATEIAKRVKDLYENFKQKSIDESNSFEAMWGAMAATENVLENLESLKNKEQFDIMKIRRLPYHERYKYLQDKFPDNKEAWRPFITPGFGRFLYIKDSYETGSVEERDKMFDIE